MVDKPLVGRFAPSPTGRMHAGNIFATLMSWLVVKSQGGRIVLRIEDLDVERSKPEYSEQLMRDLELLGLPWDDGPFYQQGRDEAYEAAFRVLEEKGLVYPCFCTRADLHAATAPHRGEKLVYAGTCRGLTEKQIEERSKERRPSWRLRVPSCVYELDDAIQGHYEQLLATDCGDFVIRRSDGLFAYQLASVVDDASQGVNCIVRGMDLLVSTPQQIYLQDMLGFEHCSYVHVPLLVSKLDRRLSKRDHDASLEELANTYKTPAGVIGHIAFVTGLIEVDEPIMPNDLLELFNVNEIAQMFDNRIQIVWKP